MSIRKVMLINWKGWKWMNFYDIIRHIGSVRFPSISNLQPYPEIKLAERHIQTNSIFSRGYYDHLSFASSHHHYLRSTANIRISKLISNSNWKFYHAKYFGEFITFTTWKVNSIKCGHTFLMCAYICWLNRNEKASARRN